MTPAPGGSRSAPPPAEGLAQHGRQVPVPAAALVQRSDQTTARRGLGKDAAGGWVKDEREVRGKEGVPVCLRRRAPQLALPDARPTTFYPPPRGEASLPARADSAPRSGRGKARSCSSGGRGGPGSSLLPRAPYPQPRRPPVSRRGPRTGSPRSPRLPESADPAPRTRSGGRRGCESASPSETSPRPGPAAIRATHRAEADAALCFRRHLLCRSENRGVERPRFRLAHSRGEAGLGARATPPRGVGRGGGW